MKPEIVVPEGMTRAAIASGEPVRVSLRLGLEWLTENPIVPTNKQIESVLHEVPGHAMTRFMVESMLAKWQRIMFLAPEPTINPVVSDAVNRLRGVNLTLDDWQFIRESLTGSVGSSKEEA